MPPRGNKCFISSYKKQKQDGAWERAHPIKEGSANKPPGVSAVKLIFSCGAGTAKLVLSVRRTLNRLADTFFNVAFRDSLFLPIHPQKPSLKPALKPAFSLDFGSSDEDKLGESKRSVGMKHMLLLTDKLGCLKWHEIACSPA